MAVKVVVDREIARHLGTAEVVSVDVAGAGSTVQDVLERLPAPGAGGDARLVHGGRLATFVGLTKDGEPVRDLGTRVQDGDVIRIHFRFMEGG